MVQKKNEQFADTFSFYFFTPFKNLTFFLGHVYIE